MATARPFSFNTGSTISGATQVGNLGIGVDPLPWCNHIGGVTWYMGADEELGYIIARPNPPLYRPRFLRSAFTEQGFLDLCNYVSRTQSGPVFTNTLDAKTWIDSEGYWTTYTGGTGPTPTPTPTQSSLPTPTPTPTISVTPSPTPTPSTSPPPNPNSFKIDFSGTTVNNLQAGSAFIPGDNSEWDMGDGNTITTVNTTFNHTYVNPYEEPVPKTIEFITDDLTKLSSLTMIGSNPTTGINKIYGVDFSNIQKTSNLQIANSEINTLDISTFTGITSTMYIYNNPQLRELKMPIQNIDSGYLSTLRVYSNEVLPELDLSGIDRIASTIQIYSNNALETLILPTADPTIGNIGTFEIRQNPNLKEIDASGLTRIGQDLRLYSNTSLTGMTFPSTLSALATDVRRIDFYGNTAYPGHLDLTMFDKLGGYVQLYNNDNLTGVTFANTLQAVSDPINTFYIRNCYELEQELDLTMFTKMGGYVYIYSNPKLTDITFAPTLNVAAANVGSIRIYGSPLNDLDLSMFTKIGGHIQLGYDSTFSNHIQTLTFPATVDAGANNITTFNVGYMSELKEMDLSSLTKLGGDVSIQFNTSMTGITFPSTVTGNNTTLFQFIGNEVLESVDLSGLTKIGGGILMFQCYQLKTITFPPVIDGGANNVYLSLHNANLTGHLDLSMFNKVSGHIWTYTNANLTGITFTNSLDSGADDVDDFNVSSCNLQSLDVTGLVKCRSVWKSSSNYSFSCAQNTGLTECSFPTVVTGATLLYLSNRIYFQNCALDQTSVDDLFAKMLEYYNVVTPVGGTCIVDVSGGTNSLPSAQGYTDIGDLETIFTNAGLTLTITLND